MSFEPQILLEFSFNFRKISTDIIEYSSWTFSLKYNIGFVTSNLKIKESVYIYIYIYEDKRGGVFKKRETG